MCEAPAKEEVRESRGLRVAFQVSGFKVRVLGFTLGGPRAIKPITPPTLNPKPYTLSPKT